MNNKTNKAIDFNHVGVYYPKPIKNFLKRSNQTEGFWALNDVSFSINTGDVLGIIGNNGAGKTTTLALVSGIIEPSKGTVNTFGKKSTLLSINAGMESALTGRKNIMLLGLALGMRSQKIQSCIDEIIEFSELNDFIDEPIEAYSSGMKARLGFSTAMVLEPEILLIDETLGVGDRNFKKKSTQAIKEKLRGRTTAVIVSHNEETILDVTTKVLWIEHGKNKAFGDPEKVIREYIASCER